MNKSLKIALNLVVFALIAAFAYYMVHSMVSKKSSATNGENADYAFASPYVEMQRIEAPSEVLCFDVRDGQIYAALADRVAVFDAQGGRLREFAITAEVRDIVVDENTVYLLHPTKVELYTLDGRKKSEWEACSDNSDYCAFTTSKNYVFVTDAENKNIVQYNKDGGLVRFIKSPAGFIIPSYAFDIICINDTLFCVNSGRHSIESYMLDGTFIAAFGTSGPQAGAFAGCCNPVHLAPTSSGNILTSEKGNPRISSYGKDGKFRTIFFDAATLGGGTGAYEMQVSDDDIYIASKKTITIYRLDPTIAQDAYDCRQGCAGCPFRNGCRD